MKKQFGKLSLSKEIISSLTQDELQQVRGGLTTSYLECTGITCCEEDGNVSGITNTATGGDNISCGLSIGCESCNNRTTELGGC